MQLKSQKMRKLAPELDRCASEPDGRKKIWERFRS